MCESVRVCVRVSVRVLCECESFVCVKECVCVCECMCERECV